MRAMPALTKFSVRLLDRVLGATGRQRLSILIYHRVLEESDYLRPGDPTAVEFDWQMELLHRHCNPLSLAEALRRMDSDKLPDRAVCVTFDDGYADNAEVALPILSKWTIPASVFVSTAFIDGGIMWNDTVIEAVRSSMSSDIDLTSIGLGIFPLGEETARRQSAQAILDEIKYLPPSEREHAVEIVESQSSCALPNNLMLTTEQLIHLDRQGVEIGAHTHTHPILASLNSKEAKREIMENKLLLEEILGNRVRFFAYPNGKIDRDYNPSHRDMIRELGFDAALTTQWGVSNKSSDRWQLPRFTPWDSSPAKFGFRLLLNQRDVVQLNAS
jgi:peptidoglycan/xylan/chitin deacetylase (PgdA/CDA1 family)